MNVILASGSPRRKELLKLIVKEFDVKISGIDETLEKGLMPGKQVERLAYLKAKDIFEKTSGDRIIIGSDTMVVKENKIYGKPKDKSDAKSMLKELLAGDRSHSVYTGICVIVQKDNFYKEYKTFDEAKVYFNEMSDDEIDKWINTGKAMDKAGAYAIQEEFGVFLDKIEGNYTTIIGLPINKVYNVIKEYII